MCLIIIAIIMTNIVHNPDDDHDDDHEEHCSGGEGALANIGTKSDVCRVHSWSSTTHLTNDHHDAGDDGDAQL